jgi:hypothetical protein
MKKRTIGTALAVVGIFATTAVFAQVAPRTGGNGAQAIQKVKEQKSIVACEKIGANVDKRTANFEKNKLKKVEQYSKIQKKVTTLVTKMEAEGYDTAQLRISMVTLDQKIAKFNTDYAVYINDLKGTKDYTCGKSEGEFKAKLAIARAQLAVVKADSVDIRTFWGQTIKPQIEALKLQTTTVETTTVEGGTQ